MSLLGSSRGVPYHGRCNPCLLDLFQHLITVFHEGFHLAQNLFVPIADPHLRPGLYSVREDRLVFNVEEFKWANVAIFLSVCYQTILSTGVIGACVDIVCDTIVGYCVSGLH